MSTTESMRRRRFVFQGVGSRGDIAPLILIGRELVRRGHECHLFANDAFGAEAVAAGLSFGALTGQTEIFWEKERTNPENFFFQCLRPVVDAFARLGLGPRRGDAASPLTSRETIVVNAERVFASNLLCELHDVPVVRLHLTPMKMRSVVAPCWPMGRASRGYLGRTFRKYQLPRLYEAEDNLPRGLAIANARRASVGLPPVDDLDYAEPYVRHQVALFPEWFAPPAEDWPYGMDCVGFPFARPSDPTSATLPPALAALLADCAARATKPLVFTPGTGVIKDVAALVQHARACCDALGRPGVFLSPHARDDAGPPAAGGQPLLCLDYVDLGHLIGSAALLVHHGGIGTTAQALRAGIPQVVVPRYFDQFDNGRRVTELGVGRVVDRAQLSGAALADAARALLDGAPYTAVAVAACSRRSAEADAVGRCADILETIPLRLRADAPGASGPERTTLATPDTLALPTPPRRTFMFAVWHEDGHLASPAAIARRLQARGDRVVIASCASFASRIRGLGFEHVNLSGASDWGRRHSIFSALPHRAALREAVDRLGDTFDAAVARVRPDAIFFDSLLAPFGIMAEAAGIPWATHEINLAVELDPEVPPPGAHIVPDGTSRTRDAIAEAWRGELSLTFAARDRAAAEDLPHDWCDRHFGASLIRELERRYGRRVGFDRFSLRIPVARKPRMILSPAALDFPRTHSARGTWVGACVDARRPEPAFPWDALPADRPIAYCAFGTQSLRNPQAPAHLSAVVDAFTARDDLFLVLACPAAHRPRMTPALAERMLWVERAPQLALLRRARAAITHAGFNTVKECAAAGVPMIAIPLSHDQPRNAALIAYHGLGVAFPPDVVLTAAAVNDALTRVQTAPDIRKSCARMQRAIEAASHHEDPLAFVDGVAAGCPSDSERTRPMLARTHSERDPVSAGGQP